MALHQPDLVRPGRIFAACLSVLGLMAAGGAAAVPLPRGALWVVVQSCVLAQRTVGHPFPCLDVKPVSGAEPGFAVLRAPDSSTHVIVTPIVHIPGIESPELRLPAAGSYWRAALDARRFVQEGAGRPIPVRAIGLAVNSARTRSQDQLHIHADCFRPEIAARLRAEASGASESWRPVRDTVGGERYFLRSVGTDELTSGNLFGLLARVPGAGGDLSGSKVLVVEGDAPGGFVVAVSRSGRTSIEAVLDRSCDAVGRGARPAS